LAFALEHANLLGQAVALALQLFGAGLQRFALAFQSAKSVHIQKELGIFTGLQTRHNSVQIFAEKNNIKHGVIVVTLNSRDVGSIQSSRSSELGPATQPKAGLEISASSL
jgi:hypothetical protein